MEHIEAPQPVHGTRSDSLGDPSGVAKLSAEEPDALMHARPGPWAAIRWLSISSIVTIVVATARWNLTDNSGTVLMQFQLKEVAF